MKLFSALYPILDSGLLPSQGRSEFLRRIGAELMDAGVTMLQYRNKSGSDREVLDDSLVLRAAMPLGECLLILNDRADLAVLAGFDGVHVGQEDLSPAAARAVVGVDRIVGVSTHNERQVKIAETCPVDYIAIGPVFATSSKNNPDPVIGIEGVRMARSMTTRPLVAIGGIALENCLDVRDAGATAVAVISSLFQSHSAEAPGKVARDFLARFR